MSVPTSFDVARLAGVSQPTVSRALRSVPGVAPATRDRVLAAARELSYVTSDSGRSLSTRRTRRVAVVSAELTNPYYPELVEPIRGYLDQHGYKAVVIADRDSDEETLAELVDGSYDGVLLTTTTRTSTLPSRLTAHQIPHVLVNRILDHPGSPSCAIDNDHGAREVAVLLASSGHERIGVVTGPTATSTSRERIEGLRRGLREHGITLRRADVKRCDYSHDDGMAAALELLDRADPPSAIACGNDALALGVLSAARRLDIAVPGDLTVVGFDGIAAASWPLVSLTTVHCDLDLLAGHAVRMLLEGIAASGASVPPVTRVTPRLILRDTHGPCRE